MLIRIKETLHTTWEPESTWVLEVVGLKSRRSGEGSIEAGLIMMRRTVVGRGYREEHLKSKE